ncbi:MAG: DNA-3-methyladenine glycosylase I [Bacteroidetes bacterium]|nr:MAG: DNA-3-methyladenine glycosylase I [Bacteroidota bacterium]REK00427.1 MAG: DNA-3-methyladenine glycosylase I [Bacteroidota bacterium]REK05066.1 MAG: DNA-3-methyladenine glycosylase I [Bacteroidota bacterium]REK35545.1 MAG: DNA-3-methyladenine glycosylase I [Bacteroidota bacterium]REK51647.1 MAG: DNA-3-methyladenine glycosylase I [Bacteroidota bacterium]
MLTYCEVIKSLKDADVHQRYHDKEYGFPILEDDELFARLVLEINQAGLSWTTILKKKENFYRAYDNFNIETVAAYKKREVNRLLNDAGIIRNRLKIEAAIHNAGKIIELKKEFASFKKWLDANHPMDKEQWVKLFKKTFRFTGGEIVNEFLVSTGYLPGAHQKNCPVYKKVLKLKPAWSW